MPGQQGEIESGCYFRQFLIQIGPNCLGHTLCQRPEIRVAMCRSASCRMRPSRDLPLFKALHAVVYWTVLHYVLLNQAKFVPPGVELLHY